MSGPTCGYREAPHQQEAPRTSAGKGHQTFGILRHRKDSPEAGEEMMAAPRGWGDPRHPPRSPPRPSSPGACLLCPRALLSFEFKA